MEENSPGSKTESDTLVRHEKAHSYTSRMFALAEDGLLFRCRRDAVGSDQERPRGDRVGRAVMILSQLAGDPLLERPAVGVGHERIAIGNPGPEGAAERSGKEPMKIWVQEAGRRHAVLRFNHHDAPTIRLPRALQALRPGETCEVFNSELVQGLGRGFPAIHVPT